jgi:hypothetical protein
MKRIAKILLPVVLLASFCVAVSFRTEMRKAKAKTQAAPSVAGPELSKADQARRIRLNENYGKIALGFEANEGQQDRQAAANYRFARAIRRVAEWRAALHSGFRRAMLRPGDEAEFVRLHQAGVGRHDADAETVGAAFSRGNASLVNVIAVPVGLAALV